MISAAQLLDELMGRDRNLAPDEKRSNVRWDHESVSPVGLGPVPRRLGQGSRRDPRARAEAGTGRGWPGRGAARRGLGDLAAPTEAPDGGGRRASGRGGRREEGFRASAGDSGVCCRVEEVWDGAWPGRSIILARPGNAGKGRRKGSLYSTRVFTE